MDVVIEVGIFHKGEHVIPCYCEGEEGEKMEERVSSGYRV